MTNEEMFDMLKELVKDSVQVLNILPGDVMFVTVPYKLNERATERMKERLGELTPGSPRVVILEEGVRIHAVIRDGLENSERIHE